MEKIVIFGSTGMTGVCAVEAAVQKGLNVRAFVRDPSKLPDHLRNSVEVVQGNALNYNDVLNAIKNVTAVVAVIGTNNKLDPTTEMSDCMSNILKAMKELNVKIISVCLSAFLFYEKDKVPEKYRDITEDHQRELDLIKNSKLQYIAILPPHITDKPQGAIIVEYDKSPGRVVSKYELGKFLVDCLTENQYYGRICGICSKPE